MMTLMEVPKSYRFELVPKPAQRRKLDQMAGARRFIWNWGLERKIEHYRRTGRNLTRAELRKEMQQLKRHPSAAWLQGVDSQLLQQALDDLHRAFRAFFSRRSGFPRFKSKKDPVTGFRIPQRVRLEDGHVRVPKIGWVRARPPRRISGRTGGARFKRDATGRWFVSIVSWFERPPRKRLDRESPNAVGIDLGVRTFATLSDGTRVANPQFHQAAERALRRAHRALSRKQRGSRNRARQRGRLARLHRRAACRRNDFLHKLTSRLVREYDVLCIEDLNVRGLARAKLSKSVLDAAFREFRRQVTYKASWTGKHLLVANRFYPSSRICNACGVTNGDLRSTDRTWTCSCGTIHDRDLNAATNLLREGLRQLDAAAGPADAENACGADVRLPMEAVGNEAGIPVGDTGNAKNEVLYSCRA
jgi:putative transposase